MCMRVWYHWYCSSRKETEWKANPMKCIRYWIYRFTSHKIHNCFSFHLNGCGFSHAFAITFAIESCAVVPYLYLLLYRAHPFSSLKKLTHQTEENDEENHTHCERYNVFWHSTKQAKKQRIQKWQNKWKFFFPKKKKTSENIQTVEIGLPFVSMAADVQQKIGLYHIQSSNHLSLVGLLLFSFSPLLWFDNQLSTNLERRDF